MKPKILLINEIPGNRGLYINTLPPLGILGIASYLEKNGISVQVKDCNINNGFHFEPDKFDIIGFSLNIANIAKSLETIRSIKRQNPRTKIIVGGPSCISNPYYFMRDKNIDAVCEGEGEESFLDYITNESFVNGKRIPGFYVRTKEGSFVYGGERGYLGNLDTIPFPAFGKVNIAKYRVPIRKSFPISSIITSRGCPFRCLFCFHSSGYKWRARSASNVVDEIEWQTKEFGVKEICIQDDNFSLDIDRAKEICDLILERNIRVKLQFQNGLRVDYVDIELLKKMQKAGVWLIGVAPETGSDKVMDRIAKNTDLKKVKQVVKWCKEIGINTYAYFMIGFPFETMQDLKKTASFAEELDTNFIQIARVTVLPKTPLYEMVVKEDKTIENMFDKEQCCFFGIPRFKMSEISDMDISRMIKKIHRDFYLKPIRMIRLMNILPLQNLITLFSYSQKTKNI
ncbi:MAG: B12-binding domain-containing radical SAM protein [Planctomycetota bacterium]|jgi:radical SAM superfamily enzyme YgiQ (UPF0313 family)